MALVMARPRSTPRSAAVVPLLAALLAGCSFLRPTAPPTTVPAGAWEERADAPASLTEIAATAHDGRVWVVGGLTAEGAGSADVFVYDPATDKWGVGPDLPGPVHHSAMVSDGES